MKLVKIRSLTKRQAKSYMIVALRNLQASPNEISEQEMWDEMETVMSIYTPNQATDIAMERIEDNYRVKNE